MATPRPSLPRNVKLLGWASCLNDIASEMIFPLLPQFLITELVGNRFHLGIIKGVADSASSLLKLWSGAWSDRVAKRKGFVICGYALVAVSRPVIGIITAPWQLLFARTADRIGKGVRTSPRDALIADSTAPDFHGRAFGFHRTMDHLGTAVGPILASAFHIVKSGGNLLVGGLVDRVGPRLPIFFGWFIYAGVYLAFALATAAWHVWAFFLIYAVFYSLTEPAEKTLVANLVGPERKGPAFGSRRSGFGLLQAGNRGDSGGCGFLRSARGGRGF